MSDEPKRAIAGCQHARDRMIQWVDNGACPICLTATCGMDKDAIASLRARIAELEPLEGRVSDLETELSSKVSARDLTIRDQRQRIAELESTVDTSLAARACTRSDILDLLSLCGIEPAGVMSDAEDLLAVRRYVEGLQRGATEQGKRIAELEKERRGLLERNERLTDSLSALGHYPPSEPPKVTTYDAQSAALAQCNADLASRFTICDVARMTAMRNLEATGRKLVAAGERIAELEASLAASEARLAGTESAIPTIAGNWAESRTRELQKRIAELEAVVEAARALVDDGWAEEPSTGLPASLQARIIAIRDALPAKPSEKGPSDDE